MGEKTSETAPGAHERDPRGAPPPAEQAEALPDFLTVPQVAALLQLSTKTIYGLARDGALAGCVRLGTTIRFHRQHLLDALEREALAGSPRIAGRGRPTLADPRRQPSAVGSARTRASRGAG